MGVATMLRTTPPPVIRDVAKYVKLLSPASAIVCLPPETPSTAAHPKKVWSKR